MSMLRRRHLRLLADRDRGALLELCERDPVANVFVTERVLSRAPLGRGGQMWGWFEDAELVSACWFGANLVLVEATSAAVAAFAGKAEQEGRRCSSIFGPAESTLALWERLADVWGTPREVRPVQPLMAIDREALIGADPAVRPARVGDLNVLIPACVAMFVEEEGYSPVEADGGWSYRARVEQLVEGGRSFVRMAESGRVVVFKAEIGAVAAGIAQVQGVYVDPRWRGRGLAAPGMAAVVELTRASLAHTVSLYVNDYNTRAVSAYERVGFRQIGTFATVLF